MKGFGGRVGLVLGVDSYAQGIPALRTAVADARSVARRLEEKHGYEATLLTDGGVTRDGLSVALRRPGATLPASKRAIFLSRNNMK